MTIAYAIARFDVLNPEARRKVPYDTKLLWLSEIERMAFPGTDLFDIRCDKKAELKIRMPFDDLYFLWLDFKLARALGDPREEQRRERFNILWKIFVTRRKTE